MLLWLFIALLILAASLAILVPLGRSRASTDAADNEIAVYKDQIAEVERDMKRGLIGTEEADQARAEIGRRIIRADATRQSGGSSRMSGFTQTIATLALVAIALVSAGLYAVLGSPNLPSQPLSARLSKDMKDSSVEELVARAENSLAKDLDDVRGWDVLAPVYVRMGRYNDGVAAYRNAIRLAGPSAERESGLGEALALASNGLITADSRKAFEAALAAAPDHAKSRFFLAMAKGQDGKSSEAKAEWMKLAAELPPENPWKSAAEQMAAVEPPTSGSAGPAQTTVPQGPAATPPPDQQAAIEGMVQGLDQRLRDNPDDVEGWKRLVRSYVVLGQQDKARDALSRAIAALGKDSATGKDIIAFAESQGVKEQ